MRSEIKVTSRLFSIIGLCLFTLSISAQEKINWMSWEEAVEKSKTEQRKIFVDIYTDWCTWCKRMDKGITMLLNLMQNKKAA